MRAGTAIGISPSWPRWAAGLAVAVVLLWLGTLPGGRAAMWGSIVAAVVATPLIVLTWRLLPLTAVLRRRLRPRRTDTALLATVAAADIAPLWDSAPAAIRGAGDEAVAVVAIEGPEHPPSVFDRDRVESATYVPVDVVAAALRQFDVMLSGIDIVSVGRRRAARAHHPYAATDRKSVV